MDRTLTNWDRMVQAALKCKGVVALDCGLSFKHGKKQQFRYQGVHYRVRHLCFHLCGMSYVSYHVGRRTLVLWMLEQSLFLLPACLRYDPDQGATPKKPRRVLKGTAYLGKAAA